MQKSQKGTINHTNIDIQISGDVSMVNSAFLWLLRFLIRRR